MSFKIKAKKLEQKQLIRVIKDSNTKDTNITFGFILGSGASKKSDIPTGEELADKWYPLIEEDLSSDKFENWKKSIDITEEYSKGKFYSEIFEKRFEGDREVGLRELQDINDDAIPSVGYSFLAQLLDETKNKFVITTNFDTMTEEALYKFTKSKPLVLGHELVGDYIDSTNMQRPTIIKIHRDFLYKPKNTTQETKKLAKQWKKSLKPVLQNNAMIVIGYGGHDDSLMTYLQNINKNDRKAIFWCYRDEQEISEKTKKLLTKKDFVVKIEGFDDFMFWLNRAFDFDLLINTHDIKKSKIVLNTIYSAESHSVQLEKLGLSNSDEEMNVAMKELLPSWWKYVEEAKNEENIEKADSLYLNGMKAYPNSYQLVEYYANFLDERKKDIKEATKFYKKAINIAPKDLYTIGKDGYNFYSRTSTLDAKGKVAQYIFDFGNKFFTTKRIVVAEILNMSPETLSRCLNYFKNEGIIDIKNEIIDNEKLENYLSSIQL